jgi:hypothetical protein
MGERTSFRTSRRRFVGQAANAAGIPARPASPRQVCGFPGRRNRYRFRSAEGELGSVRGAERVNVPVWRGGWPVRLRRDRSADSPADGTVTGSAPRRGSWGRIRSGTCKRSGVAGGGGPSGFAATGLRIRRQTEPLPVPLRGGGVGGVFGAERVNVPVWRVSAHLAVSAAVFHEGGR